MRVIRMNMNIFYAFVVISFLNRFLNPFIYASQYEVVRRTWTPLVKLLRLHGRSGRSTRVYGTCLRPLFTAVWTKHPCSCLELSPCLCSEL